MSSVFSRALGRSKKVYLRSEIVHHLLLGNSPHSPEYPLIHIQKANRGRNAIQSLYRHIPRRPRRGRPMLRRLGLLVGKIDEPDDVLRIFTMASLGSWAPSAIERETTRSSWASWGTKLVVEAVHWLTHHRSCSAPEKEPNAVSKSSSTSSSGLMESLSNLLKPKAKSD
jgi:hypothetical protein